MKTFAALLVFMAFMSVKNYAQRNSNFSNKIDSLIQGQVKNESPGCVVGIIKNGTFIHKKAYGLANLDYDIPLTTSSAFEIASTSKQFTAACIFLLKKQDRIGLDDDIRKYLIDFPFYGDTIRVKHLIYHTSGLRDYTGLMYICGYDDEISFTPNDLYQLVINQKELDFKPGSQFAYSNTGYFLLSKIVESITGMTLNEYSQKNIFVPLGMASTHFHNNHRAIIKNRAYGYRGGNGTYEVSMSNNDVVGDGGIYTTLDDLRLWDSNFYSKKLGGVDWYEDMITPGKLNDHSEVPYAGGLYVRKYKGLKKLGHTGWYAGFKSSIAQFPDEKVTVIILANNPDVSPPLLTNQLADIVLREKLEQSPPSKRSPNTANSENDTPSVVPQDMMNALIGEYFSAELNFKYQISSKDGKLLCRIGNNKVEEILFVAKDHLMVGENISLRPQWAKADKLSSFLINVGDSKNILFKRVVGND